MADLLDLIANLPQQESKGVTTPKFKNYKPMDSNFEQIKVTQLQTVAAVQKLYAKKIKKCIEKQKEIQDDPIVAAPKKADQDIERRIKSKLELLQKRTDIACQYIYNEMKSQ